MTKPSNESFAPQATRPLGILGGGQLARMMVLKCHEMGIPVQVLSGDPHDPAAQVCPRWQKGDVTHAPTLKKFLASSLVVTFESEFLDAELLGRLSQQTRTPLYPHPTDMATIQDRWTQKRLLVEHGLPTAEFVSVGTIAEARAALKQLGGQAVFKKRRFGYDGYGTFMVRSAQEFEKFTAELKSNPHGFIAEAIVPFDREVAVMIARSRNGDLQTLPFVETHQENSRCLHVHGPLSENRALHKLGKKLAHFLRTVDYVGVMGIELFATGRGASETYVINELAPRVHNSGHYSLDALGTDQFSLHVKAVMGFSFGPKVSLLSPGFAMVNLLGNSAQAPTWTLPPDINLHWYGKTENRPGRKMGHFTVLAKTPKNALRLALQRRRAFQV